MIAWGLGCKGKGGNVGQEEICKNVLACIGDEGLEMDKNSTGERWR